MAARLIGATLLAVCWLAAHGDGRRRQRRRLPRLVFDIDGGARPRGPGICQGPFGS